MKTIAAMTLTPLHQEFLHEINQWKRETLHWSSLKRQLEHPSYLRIIDLGKTLTNQDGVRILLDELATDPDHWFSALTEITGENPIQDHHNFTEAIDAWLNWGRERGLYDKTV